MKIKFSNPYFIRGSTPPPPAEVESQILWSLTDSAYDHRDDQAYDNANKCAAAVGRLVNILASKGILNAEEVLAVAGISYTGEPELLP